MGGKTWFFKKVTNFFLTNYLFLVYAKKERFFFGLRLVWFMLWPA